jgi:hypothetical protein
LHHRDNQRRSIDRHAVSDTVFQHDVSIIDLPENLHIIASVHRQQEIPRWHQKVVLLDNQFRRRISDRRAVLSEPNVKL